jgi:hypothetical protein
MTELNAVESARTVEAICQAHAELALPTGPVAALTAGSVYAIARQACLRLGFVEIDADCIAAAWQRQSERTGLFDPLAWPSEPQDFGLAPWPRENAFALCPRSLGLYAVLPDAQWVARMAEAGVPTLQLRLKSDDPAAVAREIKAAVKAVEGSDIAGLHLAYDLEIGVGLQATLGRSHERLAENFGRLDHAGTEVQSPSGSKSNRS